MGGLHRFRPRPGSAAAAYCSPSEGSAATVAVAQNAGRTPLRNDDNGAGNTQGPMRPATTTGARVGGNANGSGNGMAISPPPSTLLLRFPCLWVRTLRGHTWPD